MMGPVFPLSPRVVKRLLLLLSSESQDEMERPRKVTLKTCAVCVLPIFSYKTGTESTGVTGSQGHPAPDAFYCYEVLGWEL